MQGALHDPESCGIFVAKQKSGLTMSEIIFFYVDLLGEFLSQVAASTNKEIESQIPNYPNLPPQLICQLHNVTMHVSMEIWSTFFNSK
jgi:hypothetical protein